MRELVKSKVRAGSKIHRFYSDGFCYIDSSFSRVFPRDYLYIIVCTHSDDLFGCLEFARSFTTNGYLVLACLVYPDGAFGVWDSYVYDVLGINKQCSLYKKGMDIDNLGRMLEIKDAIRVDEFIRMCMAAGINSSYTYNFEFESRLKNAVFKNVLSSDGSVYTIFNSHESEFDCLDSQESGKIKNYVRNLSKKGKTAWLIQNPNTAKHQQHIHSSRAFIDSINSFCPESIIFQYNSTVDEAERTGALAKGSRAVMLYLNEERLRINMDNIFQTAKSQNYRYAEMEPNFYGAQYERKTRHYACSMYPDPIKGYRHGEYLERI